MIQRMGKKTREWREAKKELVKEYDEAGIHSCEGVTLNPECTPYWALSIHHLDKRSSGRAKHTFAGTRLLCPFCHNLADHPRDEEERRFNDWLRELR